MRNTRRTICRLVAAVGLAGTLGIGLAQGAGASTTLPGADPVATAKSTCTTVQADYHLWVNSYVTAKDPINKENSKDNWIAAFKLGKSMGCTWATGMPTT